MSATVTLRSTLDHEAGTAERLATVLAMTPPTTTSTAPALQRVSQAANARKEAHVELKDAIKEARRAQCSLRAIAEAAGLSHQRVYQMVGPQRPE